MVKALRLPASLDGFLGACSSRSLVIPDLQRRISSATNNSSDSKAKNWVFLGPPGVGKGTYSTRIAKHYGLTHIVAGDLVRGEIKSGSSLGIEMKGIVEKGDLLPDNIILDLVQQKIQKAHQAGSGFLLDGFPRTAGQAESLDAMGVDITLALNLSMREDALIAKCLGRRTCSKCNKGWNIADINLPAIHGTEPAIILPPLNPPAECLDRMQIREDDTEPVVRRRLDIYREEAGPLEGYFRRKRVLDNFPITGGIPETMPILVEYLDHWLATNEKEQPKAAQAHV